MNVNILLLFLAGLLSGLAQLLSKKLVLSNHQSTTYTTVVMLINAIISIPLLFYRFYMSLSIIYWLLILTSVLAFAFSTYFSYQAYKHADVSIVCILQRLNIVLVAVFGVLILQEEFTSKSVIGLSLIFLGGILLVMEKFRFKLTVGIIYALITALLVTVASILDKVILKDFSPFTYVFINNLLVGLVFSFKKGLLADAKSLVKKHSLLLILTSCLMTGSFILILIVLQKNEVSKTMPIYSSVSLLTPVLLGIIFFRERSKLLKKLAAMTLTIIGITLLY